MLNSCVAEAEINTNDITAYYYCLCSVILNIIQVLVPLLKLVVLSSLEKQVLGGMGRLRPSAFATFPKPLALFRYNST